ncbi:2,3-bisphosphoglycerate-dependent phosphoglycerate mutase [Enterococcus sp. DIV0756]|uniref:2,3-bisphosphoglycerate-dependent phosphoglycerate mutase n=1 Tax=Enterococcus sp. DIV0756 TaxID=2774636 RepID=UPI003F253C8D
MKLILVRHGESEANFENYWTGWLDVDLTEKGIEQAKVAGRKIKDHGLLIDVAYESVLKRSIKTAQMILQVAEASFVPEYKTWRLNERHYGALVGKNKDLIAEHFGTAQVKKWRRGFDEIPPLAKENLFDRRYDRLDPRLIPVGESLHMTLQRVMPLWQDQLAPNLLAEKTTLVCGHGNSLRALVQFLEDVPTDQVDQIDIPNATPMVYTFNAELELIQKEIL